MMQYGRRKSLGVEGGTRGWSLTADAHQICILARPETSESIQTGEPRRSTRGIYRFRLDFRELLREIEIRGNAAGDQPCTATECQILYRPLNENENATLERNQIGYMDKSPNQPRYEPRNVKTENVRHCGRASNHCERPFVEVTKRWKVPMAFYFSQDRFCCIGPSLHGDLGHSRQRFSFFIRRCSQITHYVNIRIAWNRQIRFYFYSSSFVGLGLCVAGYDFA